MISKRQADAAAEALTHVQQTKRRKKDSRLAWYPELEKIPYRDRPVALKDAKRRAWKSWPVLLVLCAPVALFVAWVVSRKLGIEGNENFAGAFVLAFMLWVYWHRWRTRRELLKSIWRSSGDQ
jgi:hypothetical protein